MFIDPVFEKQEIISGTGSICCLLYFRVSPSIYIIIITAMQPNILACLDRCNYLNNDNS